MPFPIHLVKAACALERDIEEMLRKSMVDSEMLKEVQKQRLTHITQFWCRRGCQTSAHILEQLRSGVEPSSLTFGCRRRSRLSDDKQEAITCDELTVHKLHTSGSSGVPLKYGISQEWRLAHNVAWRLAYRHMTNDWVRGYLDPSVKWAMMRPPGGSVDDFDHVLNCIPIGSTVNYSKSPQTFSPEVVHGSITTILEALEDFRIRDWAPKIVILAYEGSFQWQRTLVKQAWPTAAIHEEYGANDGGASAFTCEYGSLHFWSNRAFPCRQSRALRVVDLWNTAECFVDYECGDEVEWNARVCSCGSVLPVVHVQGRMSGRVVLENGAVISALCPFDSETMQNVRGVRVLVHPENTAVVLVVEDVKDGCNRTRMASSLFALGFEHLTFSIKKSISELRDEGSKFQTVTDARVHKKSHSL